MSSNLSVRAFLTIYDVSHTGDSSKVLSEIELRREVRWVWWVELGIRGRFNKLREVVVWRGGVGVGMQ